MCMYEFLYVKHTHIYIYVFMSLEYLRSRFVWLSTKTHWKSIVRNYNGNGLHLIANVQKRLFFGTVCVRIAKAFLVTYSENPLRYFALK